MKPLSFVGSSLADLRAFPASVRREIGVELMRVTAKPDLELAAKRYKMIGA